MAQLEADIGFALFRPRPWRRPADAGGRRVSRARSKRTYAGARSAAAGGAPGSANSESGDGLRVACQPSLASRLVPRAIGRLVGEWPRRNRVRAAGAEPRHDLGLPRRPGQLRYRPRAPAQRGTRGWRAKTFPCRADAVCALPRRHRLAGKRVICVEDLAGETPESPDLRATSQQDIEAALAGAGNRRRLHADGTNIPRPAAGSSPKGLGLTIVDPLPARALGLPIVLRPFCPGACASRRC